MKYIDPTAFVHEKAHVDDDVALGAETRVWQFASVTRGAILGRGCSVSPFVMLDGSVYGDGVIFSAGFAAGAGFAVGNNVFFGPSSLLVNDLYPLAEKEGYDDEALRGGERFAVIIEDDVIVGGHAVIMPGVRLGRGCVVAAGAVVTKDVPPGMIYRRNDYIDPNPISREELRAKRMRWAK